MIEYLKTCLLEILPESAVETVTSYPYITGIVSGIILTWLLILLLWLCCRTRYCRTIEISNETGSITINAEAVYNVLKKKSEALAALEITRIRLRQVNDGYDVIIRAVLDPDKGTVPMLMEKMTASVREKMTSVFGITNIGQVKLTIIRCGNEAIEDGDDENSENTSAEFSDNVRYPSHSRTITLKSAVVSENTEKKL